MLIDSHCEGAPARPIAPPASSDLPAIKLGLISPDREPTPVLACEGARR
jgi:hypothetical protein